LEFQALTPTYNRPDSEKKEIFYQPISYADINLLTKGLQGLISTQFVNWDDGAVWTSKQFLN